MLNLLAFLFLSYVPNGRVGLSDVLVRDLCTKESFIMAVQLSAILMWLLFDTFQNWFTIAINISNRPLVLIDWWIGKILPVNLLYIITLFGSVYLMLVNCLLASIESVQAKTSVVFMSLWFVCVLYRKQFSQIRKYAGSLDQDLYYKYSILLVLPLTLYAFSQQCCLFSAVDLLDVAHCSKRTPVMNEVIIHLSKKTPQGDIQAMMIVHHWAEQLNEELNEFNKLRDHPGDMTKMTYKTLWSGLCKRNTFAEAHTFEDNPRTFISQEHHSLKILAEQGSDGLERANIVGPYHQKHKMPGDVMHTQQKLTDYQKLGSTITIIGIDELKKTRIDDLPNLMLAIKGNKVTLSLPDDVPYKLYVTLQKPVELTSSIMKSLPSKSTLSHAQAFTQQITKELANAGIRHPVEFDCQRSVDSTEMENAVEIFRKMRLETDSVTPTSKALAGKSLVGKPLAESLAKSWAGVKHRPGEYEDQGGAYARNDVVITKPKLPIGGCSGLKVTLGSGLQTWLKSCIKCTPK
jgi:hypothetical protein